MFDGVPVEQFHQFISSSSSASSSSSSSIPLSLIPTPPISTSTNLSFLSFDPLLFPPPHPHPHQTLFQSHHHHHHHHLFLQTPAKLYENHDQQAAGKQEINLDTNPWSDDEVVQLLRFKSSTENWFPDFPTWEHISRSCRKLGEIGYKRSAEKCKEKFEEETCRSFSGAVVNNSRYLISDELDEHLYDHADDDHNNHQHHITIEPPAEKINHQCSTAEAQQVEEQEKRDGEENEIGGQKSNFEEVPEEVLPCEDNVQVGKEEMGKSKKRKRKNKKFEMLKGLCVDIVNKMMAQQEEMHKKLLQDMANRDEEKIAREESWRKEEMERLKKEIEFLEHEQVVARDRQSTITEIINKFTSSDQKIQLPCDVNYEELLNTATKANKPVPITRTTTTAREIPKTPSLNKTTENPNPVKDEIGKRWPKDEVLALINMRCNVYNGIGGNNEEKEGGNGYNYKGGSVWERISQGMLELGYKRSAKRCKEKWENINKYFRKTKDANKKRSLESRTCPYFHQLSSLYNQGKLAQAGEMPSE